MPRSSAYGDLQRFRSRTGRRRPIDGEALRLMAIATAQIDDPRPPRRSQPR